MRPKPVPLEAISSKKTPPNPLWKRMFLQAMARGCHLPKAIARSGAARRLPCVSLDQTKAGPRIHSISIFFISLTYSSPDLLQQFLTPATPPGSSAGLEAPQSPKATITCTAPPGKSNSGDSNTPEPGLGNSNATRAGARQPGSASSGMRLEL